MPLFRKEMAFHDVPAFKKLKKEVEELQDQVRSLKHDLATLNTAFMSRGVICKQNWWSQYDYMKYDSDGQIRTTEEVVADLLNLMRLHYTEARAPRLVKREEE